MLHRKSAFPSTSNRDSSIHTKHAVAVRPAAPKGRLRFISVEKLGVVSVRTAEAATAAGPKVQEPTRQLEAVVEQPSETGSALLLAKLVSAHSAALTAALVLKDNDEKTLITAGLDKTLACFKLTQAAPTSPSNPQLSSIDEELAKEFGELLNRKNHQEATCSMNGSYNSLAHPSPPDPVNGQANGHANGHGQHTGTAELNTVAGIPHINGLSASQLLAGSGLQPDAASPEALAFSTPQPKATPSPPGAQSPAAASTTAHTAASIPGPASPAPAHGALQVQVSRLPAPGGPVFSFVRQPSPPQDGPFAAGADVVYCGTAAKDVLAWEVRPCWDPSMPCSAAHFQVVASGYTGWVRALAMKGRWLFSCGCNYLVQHNTRAPLPEEAQKLELFKGDITALACSDTSVYAATADGYLRSWTIGKGGRLTQAAEVSGAHDGRITGILVYAGVLYSVGHDGHVRAWAADTLHLKGQALFSHGGTKLHCITLGADGMLYSGGDDALIRRWRPILSPAEDFLAALEPAHVRNGVSDSVEQIQQVGAPLAEHGAPVRTLAAGSHECLVSGDAEGTLCVWSLPARKAK